MEANDILGASAGIMKIMILVIILLSCFVPAEATVIGASKGVLDYRNVLKNGYAQELVTLTTDTDFDLSVNYKAEGDIAEWIRFDPPTQPFFIKKDNPYTIAIIIEPPGDARNERYNGSVRFVTGALAGPEGQFGTAVRTAINLKAGVSITGQEIVSCTVDSVEMDDVEESYPFEVRAVVTNLGNVRVRPEFVLEFWNQDQTLLVKTLRFSVNDSILPTVQKDIFQQLRHDLAIGQYWVRVKTPICSETDGKFLTVSVIERGGVSDKGELIAIENSAWAKVGEIVPIDAVFRNLGSRIVSAKFKGTVKSGDELFKIIDTDLVDVAPGDTAYIRSYFNPTQEGQYMITGRVLYNKKLTFERNSVLNVNPTGAPEKASGSYWNILLGVLVIVIIILLFLIIRKRRKKR